MQSCYFITGREVYKDGVRDDRDYKDVEVLLSGREELDAFLTFLKQDPTRATRRFRVEILRG